MAKNNSGKKGLIGFQVRVHRQEKAKWKLSAGTKRQEWKLRPRRNSIYCSVLHSFPQPAFFFFMYIPGPLAQDVNTHNGLDLPHHSLIKDIPYKLAFKSV